MRWGLYLSLALNLLLLGALIGGIATGARLSFPRDDAERRPAMSRLDAPTREALTAVFREQFAANRDDRLKQRAARKELMDLATAETFDRAATVAALARLREIDARLMVANSDAVLAFMEGLSVQQRREVVKALLSRRMPPQTGGPPSRGGPPRPMGPEGTGTGPMPPPEQSPEDAPPPP
jgi:uncharacterized membrane protein